MNSTDHLGTEGVPDLLKDLQQQHQEGEGLASKIPAPLLYEVNELLSKERTLMELKLLDQQLEAEEWKTKYEHLKGDVVDGVIAKHEDEYLEILDEVGDFENEQEEEEEEISKKNLASKEDLNAILMTRVDDNCADLSHLNLNVWIFNQLMKIVFGVRSEYDQVTILDLQNANVGPSMLPMLLHAVRNPRLNALDLSKNFINEDMFANLLETLRNRKFTPQYLLLNGNTHFAIQSEVYADLIHVLSSETWGLKLSLQELLNNPKEVTAEILKKNAKKVKRDASLTYRQLAKNPHRVQHFLRALNEKLLKNKKSEDEQLGLSKAEKKKAGKKPETHKLGKGGKLESRAVNSLQALTVFGLTEHHLGKDSIEILGESLTLMNNTLTDLDLSFCYMGYRGAQMIAKVLEDPDNQLICVNLRANLFGDSGVRLITDALKKNSTLTNLNLGSNFIGNDVAEELCSTAVRGKVLQYLDLSNNNIDEDTMGKIEGTLLNSGSSFFPKFDEASTQHNFISEILDTPHLLYYRPHLTKQYCGVDKWRKLFEVNLSRVYHQQQFLVGKPVVVRCLIRLSPIEEFSKMYERMAATRKPRCKGNLYLEEPFLYLNCGVTVHVELRVIEKKKVLVKLQQSLKEFEFDNRNFQNWNPRPWVPINFIAKDIPATATIEVRFVATNDLKDIIWDSTSCLAIETVLAYMTVLPAQEEYFLGGDALPGQRDIGRFIADELQYSIEENYYPELQYEELKHHQILRCVTWRWYACTHVRLKWQSKLNVAKVCKDVSEDDMYIYGNEDIQDSVLYNRRQSDPFFENTGENDLDKLRPKKFHLVHYEWAVSVHTKTGRRRIVKNIRCDGYPGNAVIRDQVDPWDPHLIDKLQLPQETNSENDEDDLPNPPIKDPLLPWTWQSYEVEINHLLPDDIIVLSAKLTADDPRAAADVVESCVVKARDFSAYMVIGDVRYFSNEELNEVIPMYRDPLIIYQSNYSTEEVDEEAEKEDHGLIKKWGKPMGYVDDR